MRVAEGDNYSISIEVGVVVTKVVSRPDLSREDGARCAQEIEAHLRDLVREPRQRVRGFVLDVRTAPSAWGPSTQASVEAMIAMWELAQRPVAVLSSTDPIQKLLVQRVVRSHASKFGLATMVERDALNHARGVRT